MTQVPKGPPEQFYAARRQAGMSTERGQCAIVLGATRTSYDLEVDPIYERIETKERKCKV